MQPGQKVSVQPEKLFARHPGLRFDASQGAVAALFAPRGAEGHVIRLSDMGMEALIELYWNANPRSAPGAGNIWRIWVRREWWYLLLGA